MGVHNYDFEPVRDSDGKYIKQKGHSDYNSYKVNKDAQRYEGYGGTRTSKLLFEYNSGNAPTISVEDEGNNRSINVDAYERHEDGDSDKLENNCHTHKYGESEGPGIFSGTDDYEKTQRDIQSTYLESTKSNDEVRTLAFQQLEELKDDDNVDFDEAQKVISNIVDSNKVTPDFQEYLDTEGAAEGSEIAKCKEDFDTANASYKEACAEQANIASGNDPALKAEKAKAQERRDTYYALLDKKKNEVGALADDIKFVDQEADESMEQIQEYDTSLLEIKAQQDDVQNQLGNVHAEQLGITKKLNSIESKISTLDTTITNEKTQMNSIDNQINEETDDSVKANLKKQKNTVNAQIQKHEEQKKALQTEQEQWQKQKEEADNKVTALNMALEVLNEQYDTTTEQKEIEKQNYEKIKAEQEKLHSEIKEIVATWNATEQKIVSEYYANLNAYKDLYDKKMAAALDKTVSAESVVSSARDALTEAKANAYEKFLEWKEQKRIEEEQRAQAEAAAAAQASGGVDAGGSVAGTADTGATSAITDGTTTASTSTSTASQRSTSPAGTPATTAQQAQSTQQLSSAKQTAQDALNVTTTDLNNIYDGNTNKLRSINSDKTTAYNGFIAKLDKIDSDAAGAINAKKAELSGVEDEYRQTRKDIVQAEIAISTKEISLAVANSELNSLIDARGTLSGVKTEGLNDEQKESLANLKKNVDKAIRRKEAEIERLNNADSALTEMTAKRDELKEIRDRLRRELKEMMADAASVHSSDAPELKSYSGAYDKASNDYDREEAAELSEKTTPHKEAVENNKTATAKNKDASIEEAKKAGDKYQFDPNVKVALEPKDEDFPPPPKKKPDKDIQDDIIA